MDADVKAINEDDNLKIELKAMEVDKYPAKQHMQRVASQLSLSKGLIYLVGETEQTIEDSDQPKPWRQRRYFYYGSGVDEPGCALTYDVANDRLTLYIPAVEYHHVIWDGRGMTIDEARARYDVDAVRIIVDFPSDLEKWQISHAIDVSPPVLFVLRPFPPHHPRLRVFMPGALDTTHLLPAMDKVREIKDDHELELMRRANAISASAHRAVLARLHTLKTETDIQALFEAECTARGARQSHQVIAGSGKNAATLHYVRNNEPLTGRQLVCLDAGAEYACYASDVGRTFPVFDGNKENYEKYDGWPSQEARDIYALVAEIQETAIAALKPGVLYHDVHVNAQKSAIRGLLRLGILQSPPDYKESDDSVQSDKQLVEDIYTAGTFRAFYPHGLGHYLGLEATDTKGLESTHDFLLESAIYFSAPCFQSSSSLEEHMVVTVGPAIYFSEYALEKVYLRNPLHSLFINADVVRRYYNVGGVRIKDDILITNDGTEVLSTAPKGREALQIIRDGTGDA